MKFSEFKYERINYEETAAQMQQIVDKLKQQTDPEKFVDVFMEYEKLEKHVSLMAVLASVRHSINTKDEFYEKENDYWDETGPLLEVYSKNMADICLAYPDRKALYYAIPETFFQLAECQVKSFDEKIVDLMQKENRLTSEYIKLKANAQIPFEGNIYNLSSISPMLISNDRNVRKAAYKAVDDFYQKNEDKLDDIYDQMVKVRTEMAQKMGYSTYTEMAYYLMQRLDYDQSMVANYRKQVLEDLVPLCQKIYQKQKERLGLDKLECYDLDYPFKSGNPKPHGSADELISAASEMYHEMSKETGEFIDRMVNDELWDLLSKDGKGMGGFCTSIPEYEVPFIFANFNGTSADVDTLTHEAGHAFQFYSSRTIKVSECQWPTMESCEIHSMSMEFFAYPWMEKFFKEDTEKYYYSHLTGTITFMPYGVLVDHFQHEVYNHPEMSKAERKACWRKLEKLYCPWIDYSEIPFVNSGTYWYRQSHIFESPFYYIDYTLAQICALQFWARNYEKDPNAFSDYLHLCQLGGTLSFTKLVKEANLKVPFEDNCIKNVAKKAEEYLNSFDDKNM